MWIQFRNWYNDITVLTVKNSSFDDWMVGTTFAWFIISIVYILFGWILRLEAIIYWLVIVTNQTFFYFVTSQLFIIPVGSVIIIGYFIKQHLKQLFNYQSFIAITFLWISGAAPIVMLALFAYSALSNGEGLYQHVSSASLGWYRYHLTHTAGIYDYKLYKCEPLGMVCLRVDQTSNLSFRDVLIAAPEENKLYVERDGEVVYDYAP